MGLKYRLFEQVSLAYGFDAIAIALVSRDSVLGVVLTSLFFDALRRVVWQKLCEDKRSSSILVRDAATAKI